MTIKLLLHKIPTGQGNPAQGTGSQKPSLDAMGGGHALF